jgi:hypothetical protein
MVGYHAFYNPLGLRAVNRARKRFWLSRGNEIAPPMTKSHAALRSLTTARPAIHPNSCRSLSGKAHAGHRRL